MIKRIKDVLVELGKGFSFVGNQYKISTDNNDYYIDLLFYHLELRCYVVIELKATEFKPEYIGQLGFYITAVNKTLKKDCDNDTIGLLLCKGKDKLSVEWSLESSNNLIGVSSYEVEKYIPKRILEKLPTEEELKEAGSAIKDLPFQKRKQPKGLSMSFTPYGFNTGKYNIFINDIYYYILNLKIKKLSLFINT